MGVSCVHGPYSHPHLIRARQAGQLPQEYRPQLRPQRHRFSDYPACTLRDGTGVSTTTCASIASWSRRHAARGRRLHDPGVVGLWRSPDARSRVMGHSSIDVTMDVMGAACQGAGARSPIGSRRSCLAEVVAERDRSTRLSLQTTRKPLFLWWPGTELNRRHRDFQSPALPTELPGPGQRVIRPTHRSDVKAGPFTPGAARTPPVAPSPRRRRTSPSAPPGRRAPEGRWGSGGSR
jgi:hypothetical protein